MLKHKHISNGLFYTLIILLLLSPSFTFHFHCSHSTVFLCFFFTDYYRPHERIFLICYFSVWSKAHQQRQHISILATFIFIMCQYADIVIMRRNNFIFFRFGGGMTRLTRQRRHKEEMRTWTWDASRIFSCFFFFLSFGYVSRKCKREKFVFTKRSRSMQMQRGRAAGPPHHQISHLHTCHPMICLSVSCRFDWIKKKSHEILPNNRASLFQSFSSLSLSAISMISVAVLGFGIAKGRCEHKSTWYAALNAPLQVFIVIAWRLSRSILCGV